MLPYESRAPSKEALSESFHPPVADRGARSDEQGRKDPSDVPHKPLAPPEHTGPASTEPPWQDYKDRTSALHKPIAHPEHTPTATEPRFLQDHKGSSAAPHKPPAPQEHTPVATTPRSLQEHKSSSTATLTATEFHVLQDQTGFSATPHKPSASQEHTPVAVELRSVSLQDHKGSVMPHKPPAPAPKESDSANTESPSLQGRKDASAEPPRPVPEHTRATTHLSRSKSGIQRAEGVERGAQWTYSPSRDFGYNPSILQPLADYGEVGRPSNLFNPERKASFVHIGNQPRESNPSIFSSEQSDGTVTSQPSPLTYRGSSDRSQETLLSDAVGVELLPTQPSSATASLRE